MNTRRNNNFSAIRSAEWESRVRDGTSHRVTSDFYFEIIKRRFGLARLSLRPLHNQFTHIVGIQLFKLRRSTRKLT